MEQVLTMCEEDPELKSLIQEHPLLLAALEDIPDLTSEQIFSIFTAVENEAYILTKEIEEMKRISQSSSPSSECLALENKELKLLLAQEQEYSQTLNKVTSIQQVNKLNEVLNDISATIKQRNTNQMSKLLNIAKLENEKKSLSDQVITLKNQIDLLTSELKSKSNKSQYESRYPEKTFELKIKASSENSYKPFPESITKSLKTMQKKKIRKIATIMLGISTRQLFNRCLQQTFQNWKFWFYKKSKFQEEVEIKVKPIQMQQSYAERTEALNKLKTCSKKCFSQLLSVVSSVNYQKPLEIDFSSCDFSKEWLDLLLQALENNSIVSEVRDKQLNLASNQLSDECGIMLANWVKQDGYLKCLILRNNDFNEMVTSSLLEAVSLQNMILMLDLSENIVSVESVVYLIQNSTSLNDLVIENCGLSGEDIVKILQAVKNSQILGLFVSYNPIEKQNVKDILSLFAQTGLKNIGLSGLPLDDTNVKDICSLVERKNYIEILHLAHLEISEQGMSGVLNSLCKHEFLKEIDLTGTSLHIPHVCIVIETCSSLKTIVLREISVSQRDYTCLAETIKKSPQLEVCLLDN